MQGLSKVLRSKETHLSTAFIAKHVNLDYLHSKFFNYFNLRIERFSNKRVHGLIDST